jgi:hypothetical protein
MSIWQLCVLKTMRRKPRFVAFYICVHLHQTNDREVLSMNTRWYLYSSCGGAKHQYMVGLSCLLSQCAKLHMAEWMWAVLKHAYLELCK